MRGLYPDGHCHAVRARCLAQKRTHRRGCAGRCPSRPVCPVGSGLVQYLGADGCSLADRQWLEGRSTVAHDRRADRRSPRTRSEEHTSELQSLMRISYAVFCLKKKIKHKDTYTTIQIKTIKQ